MKYRTTNNKAAFISALTIHQLRRAERYRYHPIIRNSCSEIIKRRNFKKKWLIPTNPEEGC
jgi:hypothetical protein